MPTRAHLFPACRARARARVVFELPKRHDIKITLFFNSPNARASARLTPPAPINVLIYDTTRHNTTQHDTTQHDTTQHAKTTTTRAPMSPANAVDDKDEEIARLRRALHRATDAAMAYATSSAAAVASMKTRLVVVEDECARARARDAAMIEALTRERDDALTSLANAVRIGDRGDEETRERDDALTSLANAVRIGDRGDDDDDDESKRTSLAFSASDVDAAELESVRQRCEVAERVLNDLREEGLCLADEAAKASVRHEEFLRVLSVVDEAKKDLAAAHELVGNRRRNKLKSSPTTTKRAIEN